MKSIFLHMGSDKTGSTSIQYMLDDNRDLLRENGFIYPDEINHYYIASHFSNNPFLIDLNRVREFDSDAILSCDNALMQALVNQLEHTEAEYLILSYEGFPLLSESELRDLQRFLKGYCQHIEVLYYLRAPLPYAVSAMSERIKYGEPSWDVHPPITPHAERLATLARVFGTSSIRLREFDKKTLVNGDAVSDFLHAVGVPTALFDRLDFRAVVRNEGLSEEAIQIGDEIIRLLAGHVRPASVFRNTFHPTLQQIKGRGYRLNQLQVKVIQAATAGDIAYLRDAFGFSFDPDSLSCPQAFNTSAISAVTAVSLARILIAQLLPGFQLPSEPLEPCPPDMLLEKAHGKITCLDPLPVTMKAANTHTLRIMLSNDSSLHWRGKIAPVNLSYHWRTPKRKPLIFDGLRTSLPSEGLAPGTSITVEMQVKAPAFPGDYLLELTLVQEFHDWLENRGFSSRCLPVRVTA